MAHPFPSFSLQYQNPSPRRPPGAAGVPREAGSRSKPALGGEVGPASGRQIPYRLGVLRGMTGRTGRTGRRRPHRPHRPHPFEKGSRVPASRPPECRSLPGCWFGPRRGAGGSATGCASVGSCPRRGSCLPPVSAKDCARLPSRSPSPPCPCSTFPWGPGACATFSRPRATWSSTPATRARPFSALWPPTASSRLSKRETSPGERAARLQPFENASRTPRWSATATP